MCAKWKAAIRHSPMHLTELSTKTGPTPRWYVLIIVLLLVSFVVQFKGVMSHLVLLKSKTIGPVI